MPGNRMKVAWLVTGVVALTTGAVVMAAQGGDAPDDSAQPETRASAGQGIGDPYYPDDGNLGYDVKGYTVRLDYHPATTRIDATTTITAVATQQLPRVNFDLIGMHVIAVLIDGRAATFARAAAHELVVRPARPVSAGSRFVTSVRYRGSPGKDPLGEVESGWHDATTPGGGFIAGEPHSCTLWYPCNDHPTDKARFRLAATVPRPFAVVSVGKQLPTIAGRWDDGTRVRTYRWRLAEATATYLTTMYVDRLSFERSTLADGTPVLSAYGPHPGAAPQREAKLPEILDVLVAHWGPYPAPAAGGIFVNGDVLFSLETFTRPIYIEGVGLSTIVHENGHQWWGDNVSVERWRDVCLNECLASYSQWLWDEHNGADLDQRYRDGVDDPSWMSAPLYDMGAGHEFDFQGVYVKGSFFVHALRNKVGDDAFFTAMQAIQATYAGGNLSMLDLRDELATRSGVDLTSFWDEWVLGTGTPSPDNLYPGDLSE